MKPAASAKLDQEQRAFLDRLNSAVDQINEADKLLAVNKTELAGSQATAIALSAIAKLLALQLADKADLNQRIHKFAH